MSLDDGGSKTSNHPGIEPYRGSGCRPAHAQWVTLTSRVNGAGAGDAQRKPYGHND